MRERAIKFLAGKLKTLPEDVMTKEVEEYVFAETKKVVKPDKCVYPPPAVEMSDLGFGAAAAAAVAGGASGTGEHLCEGCDCPQVLEDVTGEEFVLLMRVVSSLRVLQTVSGRQQLVELVVEQAFLEQALNHTDPDTVDRLLQCTRQALPLFSVSASAAAFVLVECVCHGSPEPLLKPSPSLDDRLSFPPGRKMSIPPVL